MPLKERKRHVAEDVAAVAAVRDAAETPPRRLERVPVASRLKDADLRPPALEAGVVHPSVGTYDRHEKREAPEAREVPDAAQVMRDAEHAPARLLEGKHFVNELHIAPVAAERRVHRRPDDLGRDVEAERVLRCEAQDASDLVEVLGCRHGAQDEPRSSLGAPRDGEAERRENSLRNLPRPAEETGQ